MSRDRDDDSPASDVPRRPYTLLVRARLSHPDLPLAPALADASQMCVRPRSTILGTDRFFVAGFGDDLVSFEDALADDPTVAEPSLIGEFADRRVYRIGLTNRSREKLSPLDAAEAYIHDASGTHDGWTVRMEMPNRDALVKLVRKCRDGDIDLNVRRIEDTGGVEQHHNYGLTSEQERILRVAYETGYFEVPRKNSQTDLAQSFDLSTSAVSQHLRRATAELVGNTLLPRREP